jgi:cell division protein ZapA
MNQIEVTILGQSYMLGCPEGGEALLRQAVAQVHREMSAIRDAGKVKARERIAVLAALNLAYQVAEGAPHPAKVHKANDATTTEQDLSAVMARIDAVLGDDGQLL